VQLSAHPHPAIIRHRRALRAAITVSLASATVLVAAAPVHAATSYTFVNVADSAELNMDPAAFGCAGINNSGQVAFRAGRLAPDGFNTIPGIYRANVNGTVSVIAENGRRYGFIGFNPSMNDRGVVSFAANIDGGAADDFEAILVGAGGNKVSTIADTRGQFNFFGFDTSINNRREVAFKAELDNFDEGLFSGTRAGAITTHYLNATSDFGGTDSRPSINDRGNIAFEETIDFQPGIFAGQEGQFQTVLPPAEDVSVSEPVLNNGGLTAFSRSFSDGDEFVFEIDTATANGTPTPVADTRGPFSGFGFRPPALNNNGEVAFLAILDDFVTEGIFVGPDPVADKVISTTDTLAGDTIASLRFCEEGVNDSGQLTFIATLQDPVTLEPHTAVFRATPAP